MFNKLTHSLIYSLAKSKLQLWDLYGPMNGLLNWKLGPMSHVSSPWFLVFCCLLQKSELFSTPFSCEVRIILPPKKMYIVVGIPQMGPMLFHLINLNSLPDSHTFSEVLMVCKFSKCTGVHIQNMSYSFDLQNGQITHFANTLLFFSTFPIHSLAHT